MSEIQRIEDSDKQNESPEAISAAGVPAVNPEKEPTPQPIAKETVESETFKQQKDRKKKEAKAKGSKPLYAVPRVVNKPIDDSFNLKLNVASILEKENYIHFRMIYATVATSWNGLTLGHH